jgi:hemoglobin
VSGPTSTLYEHAGGEESLHRFVEIFYGRVLEDPLLQPLFGRGHPDHVPHLTALLAEVFGGPTRYSDEHGGFPALLAAHRGKKIDESQQQRFVELFLAAADDAGLPVDAPFRRALRSYVVFGAEVAARNSHASTDADLHPCQEIPRWDWSDGES